MNGRVYDYNLGRFLSVDPFIHADSLGINPYSYILNNPLAGTDPSGYKPCVDVSDNNCGGAVSFDDEHERFNVSHDFGKEGLSKTALDNGSLDVLYLALDGGENNEAANLGSQSNIAKNEVESNKGENFISIGCGSACGLVSVVVEGADLESLQSINQSLREAERELKGNKTFMLDEKRRVADSIYAAKQKVNKKTKELREQHTKNSKAIKGTRMAMNDGLDDLKALTDDVFPVITLIFVAADGLKASNEGYFEHWAKDELTKKGLEQAMGRLPKTVLQGLGGDEVLEKTIDMSSSKLADEVLENDFK